jgi:hypothetical protein
VHPIRIPNSPYLPKLQGAQFALNGKIPKKLALIKLPNCTRCLFGAMTKIPWRGKESKSSHKVFATTKPGETVSVDQMVSTKVGFFAKHAFEKFTTEHGVPFHHYHCDNGLYANDAFKESCKSSHQRLTFCGVNAHFQNGIAISESKQKQLLHAQHALWTAAVHFAPWPYATWNVILLNFARPAISTATNGDYSLQLIVKSFFTGANQVAPATTICNYSFKLIFSLASEGAALCSEGAQPAPTILCNELCGHGLFVDFIPTTSNLLLSPVLNCSATSHLLLPRIHECSAITMTNDPFQLIVISVSEGACTAPITFEQSQQPKHNLVDHYEVIGRANLIDPIKFVGHNGRISLISLKLIGINGLVVKCNGLFDFIGIFGIDLLVGIVDLSCLDDLIGLVDLVEIPTPEWPPDLGQP